MLPYFYRTSPISIPYSLQSRHSTASSKILSCHRLCRISLQVRSFVTLPLVKGNTWFLSYRLLLWWFAYANQRRLDASSHVQVLEIFFHLDIGSISTVLRIPWIYTLRHLISLHLTTYHMFFAILGFLFIFSRSSSLSISLNLDNTSRYSLQWNYLNDHPWRWSCTEVFLLSACTLSFWIYNAVNRGGLRTSSRIAHHDHVRILHDIICTSMGSVIKYRTSLGGI